MKSLITNNSGILGPFFNIENTVDGWQCDELGVQTSVVGTASIGTWVTPPVPFDRPAAGKAIDAAVLAVYDKPVSLADEYKAREAAAQAYKDAGYTGTVPARVAGFATPAGMTPTAATDLILSQAAQLRGALAQLADLRMQKYAVARAATDAAAKSAYDAAMSTIAAIAAALG